MTLPQALSEPDELRKFIRTLDAGTRARGEAYFQQGRVKDLTTVEPGVSFIAGVEGSRDYEVTIRYEEDAGWEIECTCPIGGDCKHSYAAVKTLLAEHTRGSVQALSAKSNSLPANVIPLHGGGAGRRESSAVSFPDEVAAALGRALTAEEKQFLVRLQRLYARCQSTRQLTLWDLSEIGISLQQAKDYTWKPLRIWPSFPATLREFWLYIAHAAIEDGAGIPEFLQPVTNLESIVDGLRRWKRSEHIQRWRQTLDAVRPWTFDHNPAARKQIDLRVCFDEQSAELEWQQSAGAPFKTVNRTQAMTLQHFLQDGSAALPIEAEWIWQLFEHCVPYGDMALSYHEAKNRRALAKLFRVPTLHSRLVNELGQPLRIVTEPLQWKLESAPTENDDYHLHLVQSDGKPAPGFRAVFEGAPTLYLSQASVFPGPASEEAVLNPRRENVIPAPALETRGGVALLHALQIELPPRLQARVEIIPLALRLQCELKPQYPGTDKEACTVSVQAISPDEKHAEAWDGYRWAGQPKAPAHGKQKLAKIVYHDRAALHDPNTLLMPLGAKWEGYAGHFSVRVTKKFPEQFVDWVQSLPPGVKLDLRGELATLMESPLAGQVRLDATEAGIDWFDLRVVLDIADTTLTPEEIKLLLDARGGFVRLGKKGWRRLAFNLSDEEDEKLARLGLNPRELTSEPQRLHALQLADKAAQKFLPEAQFERIQRRAGEIKARVTPPLPTGVQADLRPYQLDGFHFLAYLSENNFGGILADDMGLGKTLQTLTWLAWLREKRDAGAAGTSVLEATPAAPVATRPAWPSLVVCPKSVMDNWRSEVERFTPGLRVKTWAADELKQFTARLHEADLHVLNYNQLRSLGESLAPQQWHAVILDEGQYIKNPSSVTAQIARQLRAEHRLILSGTPIENRLTDLWSLMSFAMPGALGSRAQFAKLYDAKGDPFARRRLSARVRPFLLRRTKSQVAKDLPDRIEEDLFCTIEGEQLTLYRAELKRAQQMLLKITTQKQLSKERFNFLTSLLRLRQICCHPKLVKADSKAESAKVEALLEQVEPLMEEGHKVLVFSQFVTMLDLLRPALEERGWRHFYLAGETENRGDLVREFQATEGAAVFLISLKAGGFGLNLTAASYVVLFDPWWNPAVENQAIDRTHRIGQTRNVIAYRLLIKDSIEEKIRALQKTKSALAEDVLGEEKFSQSLTLDDLKFLLS
ncbi:MAG TPA: DEAD/DEAH box helicase [Methylomirabilota bacterium]|nr:DEAD/DEAH box helicase [Methylomirabilota bacterium]